ncbi:alpha/beta hydrolase [Uliginosibacterium gangwonense]|uniref:alpha/beta hydrolase n=1 Tax=Uliginosibacterium gangwonense TaxID=392736 RepID=UPI0003690D3D|nr:alpha/beta hydrolase [Uliginosibacterium gangwonense]
MSYLPERIRLWPADAPGSEGLELFECIEERSPDPDNYGDRAISSVQIPELSVWRAKRPNGVSIILAPGGGYRRIVVDKEGSDIARWLNDLGITVFVLKYRLPGEGHAQKSDVPLQDVQRALRLVRSHAATWGLDPARMGVMGCSAGGHVMASLATRHAAQVYAAVDHVDQQSARPDFVILLYPVITMRLPFAHQGSRLALLGDDPDEGALALYSCEAQVSAGMPPHFISLANDDASVPAENSISYYHALRRHKLSVQLHVFEQGGHGHAIRHATGPVTAWTALLEAWLTTRVFEPS